MDEENKSNVKNKWQAEITNPELIEPFKNTMREVIDPEIGMNIIELGLIRDLKIEPDNAKITMILTTPFCPYGPAMLEMTREKAEKFFQKPTRIEMGTEMWDFSMMEDGIEGNWGLY